MSELAIPEQFEERIMAEFAQKRELFGHMASDLEDILQTLIAREGIDVYKRQGQDLPLRHQGGRGHEGRASHQRRALLQDVRDQARPRSGRRRLLRRQRQGRQGRGGLSLIHISAFGRPERKDDMLLIRNAKILTMEDQDYPDGGDILVDEGKILAVGADLPAPDAEVFNARGLFALPGIVDAHSHIGICLLYTSRCV